MLNCSAVNLSACIIYKDVYSGVLNSKTRLFDTYPVTDSLTLRGTCPDQVTATSFLLLINHGTCVSMTQ